MALRASPGAVEAPEEHGVEVSAPAEAVREALQQLERGGRLTPAQVVEAARDESSPLHTHFEWDDSAAAESFSIDQARRLIRSVQVVVTYETHEYVIPRYLRDTAAPPDRQGYVSAQRLTKEPENAQALLRYEFSRAGAHVNRAVSIAEAVGLAPEARRIAASIERLLKKLG